MEEGRSFIHLGQSFSQLMGVVDFSDLTEFEPFQSKLDKGIYLLGGGPVEDHYRVVRG